MLWKIEGGEIDGMMQSKRGIIKKLMALFAVLSLLIIFKDVAIALVDKVIVPITSKVSPDSLVVLFFIITFVIATYLTNGLLVYKKNYIKHPQHTFYLAAIALVFYSLFRCCDHYIFYGYGRLAYVDVSFITAAILEILSYIIPVNRNTEPKRAKEVVGFVSDNPSKTDKLERTDYAEMLLNKIYATYKSGCLSEGSMTILLNERYGAGKTTFFNLLEEQAEGKVRTCVFKPWQTSDGNRITEELLKLLEEQYAISSQLRKQLEGYSKLLAGSQVKNAVDFAYHLTKGGDSLARRYKTIKEMLKVIDDPLLVLVDDVDRLQAEELLALLKLLRDTADFPNIIYIVAADKEAMSQMLEMRGIKDADEYLKKFFNFELLFPIDDSYLASLLREQVMNTLTHYYGGRLSMPSIEKEFLSAKYIEYVFHSPRDIYRFVNLLSYTLDLFKRYGVLEEVYVPDLLKLLLIQFISPMVYKILRDEMDLFLVVNGRDGRIHLKDGYKDIIISRQYKKKLQDVLALAKQKMNNEPVMPQENTIEDEDALTLFDIPAEERPNREDILSELLRDLFYDTQNYQNKSRICFFGEYFKFFAGKYSKSELSSHYMKSLMELQNDAAFEETLNKAIGQGKSEFLVHKLKLYIEDGTKKKDIPFVLQRCILIQDAIYRHWAKRHTAANSPKDFSEMGWFQPVYMNLLLVNKKDIVTDAQEIARIKAIYVENKLYAWLASSLTLPISDDHGMLFVYGQELHLKLREGLIRRFIADELANNPFEIEKIKAIPILKSMYHVYWEERFKEYVGESKEPMAWLYILFNPVGGDLLEWNSVYYNNLVGEGFLDNYAKETLGLELSQEIKTDLAQISGMHYGGSITATNFEHHPFLVEAKKWWDAKEDKK